MRELNNFQQPSPVSYVHFSYDWLRDLMISSSELLNKNPVKNVRSINEFSAGKKVHRKTNAQVLAWQQKHPNPIKILLLTVCKLEFHEDIFWIDLREYNANIRTYFVEFLIYVL